MSLGSLKILTGPVDCAAFVLLCDLNENQSFWMKCSEKFSKRIPEGVGCILPSQSDHFYCSSWMENSRALGLPNGTVSLGD